MRKLRSSRVQRVLGPVSLGDLLFQFLVGKCQLPCALDDPLFEFVI
jgi:hypothetical protein